MSGGASCSPALLEAFTAETGIPEWGRVVARAIENVEPDAP
jgi:hypothetical protein